MASIPSIKQSEIIVDTPPSSVNARCQPDPFDPESVICLSKVDAEDRQGVSHFFGRNKKATSSIPVDLFPLLCRTHYQEKQYRWREDPVAFSAYQCDQILMALGKMALKTWIDEEGNSWPYWCGFELQLQKQATPRNSTSTTCPEWLEKLCDKEAAGQEQYASIGDRSGIRVSFEELVLIVCAIKSWCLKEGSRLPPVEALPIPIGMVDELDVETAKADTRFAIRNVHAAEMELVKAQGRSNNTKERLQMINQDLEDAKANLSAAQIAEAMAKEDAQSSQATVPVKRQTKKSLGAKKKSMATDEEMTDVVDDETQHEGTVGPSSSSFGQTAINVRRKGNVNEAITDD